MARDVILMGLPGTGYFCQVASSQTGFSAWTDYPRGVCPVRQETKLVMELEKGKRAFYCAEDHMRRQFQEKARA